MLLHTLFIMNSQSRQITHDISLLDKKFYCEDSITYSLSFSGNAHPTILYGPFIMLDWIPRYYSRLNLKGAIFHDQHDLSPEEKQTQAFLTMSVLYSNQLLWNVCFSTAI